MHSRLKSGYDCLLEKTEFLKSFSVLAKNRRDGVSMLLKEVKCAGVSNE